MTGGGSEAQTGGDVGGGATRTAGRQGTDDFQRDGRSYRLATSCVTAVRVPALSSQIHDSVYPPLSTIPGIAILPILCAFPLCLPLCLSSGARQKTEVLESSTAELCVCCRRLQAALSSTSRISTTPAVYASVYSRRSIYSHARSTVTRPCAPGNNPPNAALVPVPPRAERGSVTERVATYGRRSRKLAESATVPKSPSPPCDSGPSPPLVGAHVDAASVEEGDPVEKWLQEKQRRQAALTERQDRRRQADLKFTARMQERQKERMQTARLEARCSSLAMEVEAALKAFETAWRQETDHARPSTGNRRSRHGRSEFGTQQECEKAGEAVCGPLRARVNQINADARRCNFGTGQLQKSVAQRLEKLQELQTNIDNAMLAEIVKSAPSRALPGGLKGLAGLASLAARASVRQAPAPLTLDDMADDVEFWSRHAQPEDAQNSGKPQPPGPMSAVMTAYQNVRENIAWRVSLDPTGRHSASLRALSELSCDGSQLRSPEHKLPSSARARAAARRSQPMTSTRQGIRA